MSNKTLLYTSSLLPSFWIFCNDWHALQAEFFHLQLAPKKPKSLPGLSVFPSRLKAFWKTQIQVLLCDFAQNRSPLATVLDICKNALCLILFTATWAWDTSWKFCTCLNEKGQIHVPQAFLVPVCAPRDCLVSPSVICLAQYHLFFSYISFVIPFFIFHSF